LPSWTVNPNQSHHIHITSLAKQSFLSASTSAMYLQLVASLVAASAAPAFALPATTPNTKSAFVVNQEPAGQVLMSGPIQLAKVYGKYAHTGAVAPADVKAAAAAAQSGSVSANPQQVCQLATFHQRWYESQILTTM
jgi:hypothetical protein